MTGKQEKFYRKYFEGGMNQKAAMKAYEEVYSTKTFTENQKKDKIFVLLKRHEGITLLEHLKEKAPFSKEKYIKPKETSCARPGDKIALKTGERETILFDQFSPEEQDLYCAINPGRSSLIMHEIRLSTIRERRMMQRIERYNDIANEMLVAYTETNKGEEKDEIKERKEAAIKTVLAIEDALTRVQGQKAGFMRQLARLEELEGDGEEQETALDRLIAAQDGAIAGD